ncbi:aminopeptidase P family protein [Microbulbifer hydrolyticus]|uniref:M24 family metallopeptidase n=1 Tax=Microbulbifer hydrolyticus TaxID=48074 RepID=A0A6P1TC82_9GAMM|nr:aminopeptidase P family protein [Microbulbifer hydrolyticus]MBB5212923.1 Xaa-Pro aminopeptidase [Microbulbifer hydrolyticus]QHQ38292.1 M24 family metallopeptidase [Microbulbifer hydrolyticus]
MSQERLEALQQGLSEQQLQGFLVPRCDEYQNEYVPAADERLAWLTGFTGSAGLAAVTNSRSALFVDGRYTIQAKQQIGNQPIEQQSLAPADVANWLCDAMREGDTLGYDPRLHTQPGLAPLKKRLDECGIKLQAVDINPVDSVWSDRPAPPSGAAHPHPQTFTGEGSASKRQRIGKILGEKNQQALWLANPEVCAWLFNIRGSDIPHLPVALSMGFLYADGSATLYLAKSAIGDALRQHLGNDVEIVSDKAALFAAAERQHVQRVWADPLLTNCWTLQELRNREIQILLERDPITVAKARKNTVELEGSRAAHVRDGAALCEFLAELPEAVKQENFGELEAVNLLRSKRELREGFTDDSFDSISGYGGNGAIVHYRVTPESSLPMREEGIYLIDSGGQYPDGTTDVTRTIALGSFPGEAKEHFTRVLKGHIAIASLRFPEGTCGEQIDAFARQSLWSVGLDYAHGTGHGVGSFLSVHEGPQRIGKANTNVPLEAGMIVSNEPGFYRTDEYGIRIENLIFVKSSDQYPGFLEFEALTLAPIERQLIEPSLLTDSELEWLNGYHAQVRETLSPLVNDHTRSWLEAATRPIAR